MWTLLALAQQKKYKKRKEKEKFHVSLYANGRIEDYASHPPTGGFV